MSSQPCHPPLSLDVVLDVLDLLDSLIWWDILDNFENFD